MSRKAVCNMDYQKKTDLIICFDESGKHAGNPIQLMGVLSIPTSIRYVVQE
ncbi:hypothetical protein [Ammoniphilus oxalaticus]|uniref:hypothetical protein n=1 Tax=Ammoniphilus oxalaticus TaxID=66863 RepID=UPI0014745104|nr:hypothetical protein [Ammoniphilus oxalaticus]